MPLHPEDRRYWVGWAVAGLLGLIGARVILVEPLLRAIERLGR